MRHVSLITARLSLALFALTVVGCGGQRTSPPPTQLVGTDRALPIGETVRLHYVDWGGTGATVVLLPGLGNTAHIYDDFAPLLRSEGFRVVALTRRGHGRSSAPPTGYEPDSLAEDIRVLLDTLAVQRAHLVGHSLAGVEITRFATRHPERIARLVYLDAAYDRRMQLAEERPDPSTPSFPTESDRADWSTLLAFFRRPDQYYGRVWSAAVEADLRERYAPGADGRLADRTPGRVYGAILQGVAEAAPDYSGIKAPALSYYALMSADRLLPLDATAARHDSALSYQREVIDPWTRASEAQLRRGVPGAHIVELQDTYHHAFLQRPVAIAREVAAFLRGE